MRGLGRYYELHVLCRGTPDAVTGYFLNIKQIDRAVHEGVIPYLNDRIGSMSNSSRVPMGRLMQTLLSLLQEPLVGSVTQIRLSLTRYHDLEIRSHDMHHVTLRQRYEFSAAHRLHVPQYSEAQNRDTFGKCNNPSGHGHNYQLDVAVLTPIHPDGTVLLVEQLDTLVDEVVIQPFDHKHLNLDVPQFAQLNPSVENIAKVIYEMLEEKAGSLGIMLESVRVWENEKTGCTYRKDVGRES